MAHACSTQSSVFTQHVGPSKPVGQEHLSKQGKRGKGWAHGQGDRLPETLVACGYQSASSPQSFGPYSGPGPREVLVLEVNKTCPVLKRLKSSGGDDVETGGQERGG